MPSSHRCRFAAVTIIAAVLTQLVRAQTEALNRTEQAAAELRTEYQVLSSKYSRSMPGWRPKAPATGSLLFIAPDQYTPAGHEGNQFRNARNQYADSLFELAKRAAAVGQSSQAFQWATETVRENPDHAEARRVLGYEQRDGHWLTAYGAKMFDAGKMWHPKFGWIIGSDLPRYEAGERFVGGRWISNEDDAQRHADIRRGWRVRTDHFRVITNHSLEAAAQLGARLERLHQLWRQLFAGFYLPEREVKQLFSGERSSRRRSRPFRVFYHRNREQYADALRRRQPRIDETLGIYFDTNRESHFFAGDDQDPGTLYHEAVHQLFQESRPSTRMIGNSANFWIIEGVATYFETLAEHNDPNAGLYYTVGEATAGRLPAARQRLLEDEFYIPLAELNQLGKADVQRHPQIAKLYSQAAGLASFLMDAEGGRYREPLVTYLTAVYAGRDSAETLADVTGLDNAALDAAYRRYMESLP
jgi:hypothetical protein